MYFSTSPKIRSILKKNTLTEEEGMHVLWQWLSPLSTLGLVILTCECPSSLSTMMLHKITKAATYIDFFNSIIKNKINKKLQQVGTIFNSLILQQLTRPKKNKKIYN